MPNFKYKIRDKHGRASAGTIEGDSKEAVAAHFKKMGYVPILIEEKSSRLIKFNPFERFLRTVKLEELIIFTRQLMTLQRAGVPILTSLGSIRDQIPNNYFKKIIEEILRSVESGKSLSIHSPNIPVYFQKFM